MTYHSGWDYFAPSVGTCDTVDCLVCGARCSVVRNLEGPTSSVAAMMGTVRRHDKFFCGSAGQPWHNQVLALKKEQNETVSTKIKAILQEEIDEAMVSRSVIRG